jgi:hypothetical protein
MVGVSLLSTVRTTVALPSLQLFTPVLSFIASSDNPSLQSNSLRDNHSVFVINCDVLLLHFPIFYVGPFSLMNIEYWPVGVLFPVKKYSPFEARGKLNDPFHYEHT